MTLETTERKAVEAVQDAAALCGNVPEPSLIGDSNLEYRKSASGGFLIFDLSEHVEVSEYIEVEKAVQVFIDLINISAKVESYCGGKIAIAIKND